MYAVDTVDLNRMGAKFVGEILQLALTHQVAIEITERRIETIRVVDHMTVAVFVQAQPIVSYRHRQARLEQTGLMHTLHRGQHDAVSIKNFD